MNVPSVQTQESMASISRRFSDSVCVSVAKSVSQLPMRDSRCASLSCSSRRVASACSLWLSAAVRSRSTAAIRRLATDSTKARSLEEKASRWRLQATSSPNAVAPDPIGAATRLSMPSAASPGASNVVSMERSALSSVSPVVRMWPTVRRTSGEGTGGGAGDFSPELARTEISPLAVVSSTMIRSLASVSWSTRAASASSSSTGMSCSVSDPSVLTAACWARRRLSSSRPSTRSVMSWAITIAPAGPACVVRGAKWSQYSFWLSADTMSVVRDSPASAARQCVPTRSQAGAGMMSWRSRPTAARLS